jgi:hypothetical protein
VGPLQMHLHQYLQMHILNGIVADVPPAVRMIGPVPRVRRNARG